MLSVQRPHWQRYGIALLSWAVALVVTLQLHALLPDRAFTPFWAAIAISAWYGGIGPAVLTFFLAIFADNYFFISPVYTFQFDLIDIIRTAFFGVILYGVERNARRQRELDSKYKLVMDASALLASSLDYRTTLSQVARMVVPTMADWCILDVLDEDGRLRRLEVVHSDPSKAHLAQELKTRYPVLEPHQKHTLQHVIQSKQAWLDPAVSETRLYAQARDEGHYHLLRSLGFKSEIVVQLETRGKLLGALTLIYGDSGRRYRPGDVQIAQELARRAALAVDNAWLYQQSQRQSDQLADLLRREQEARMAAEAADTAKLQFLAMVSHELRNPLASIKGFISTLLATDVTWSPEQQRDFLQTAENEADHLNDLVEQLLDLSRMQSGTLRISPEEQPITAIFNAAESELHTLAAEHRLDLHVPRDLPFVLADSRRIGQVLANLVDNAAKYSPRGTGITVTAQRINDCVRVDVADEGEGIDETQRDAVFEMFRQLPRSAPQKGAGLGLAICKGLVEAHGGQIWIEPREGHGTTVSFTLPIVREGTPAQNTSN